MSTKYCPKIYLAQTNLCCKFLCLSVQICVPKLKIAYLLNFCSSQVLISGYNPISLEAKNYRIKKLVYSKIQDGPISFEVAVQSSVDYLKNYYGSKGLCFAQYIVNPRPESAFIPSIGIGLNNLGEDVLISESNSPNITIIIQTNSEDENLYKWASEKQKNWNESPTGVLYSSNFLTTKKWIQRGFNS